MKTAALLALLVVTGCGPSARDFELNGRVEYARGRLDMANEIQDRLDKYVDRQIELGCPDVKEKK